MSPFETILTSSNAVIEGLLNHRSIRAYKPDPIPTIHIQNIVRAAQAAATSSNFQAYSIIHVTDAAIKKEIGTLAGPQPYVIDAPEFLVFTADYRRLQIAASVKTEAEIDRSLDAFLIGAVDASLAAQNAVVAAESLGYGTVYIGGIRRDLNRVSELLGLPELVVPLFGLVIGVPAEEPVLRPRLPLEAVVYENRYDEQHQRHAIHEYDEQIDQYVQTRSLGQQRGSWTGDIAKRATVKGGGLSAFLRKQGFEF